MVNELESYFSGKNVCVLGGAGFIGSALVHGLVEYKAKVTVVDGLMPSTGGEYANLERYKQKITFYPQRLEKCTELRDLLPKSDLIIDSMGYTRHNQAFDDPFFDVEINLLSHLYLVNALKGLRGANIIYLGGRGQYGNRITDDFIVETSCQSPSDVQGVTKSAAESLFRIYAGRYGFNAVSLRMTNCFGEGQLVAGEDIGFLGVLIRDLLRGETYQVFGSLNRIVNLLYIWDAVDAILRTAMNQPRGFDAFNVAGQAIDLKTLLDLMISRIGSGSYQLIATPDRYRGFISKADIVFRENKLIDLIGNYQRTSLEQALDRTVAYFESRE